MKLTNLELILFLSMRKFLTEFCASEIEILTRLFMDILHIVTTSNSIKKLRINFFHSVLESNIKCLYAKKNT